MSGLGAGDIRPSSLKPGLGTRQCRLGLSRGGVGVRPDMSDPGSQTCSARVTGTRPGARISPAKLG
jgi:hypothetical protein